MLVNLDKYQMGFYFIYLLKLCTPLNNFTKYYTKYKLMIKPLICGLNNCSVVDQRGNHGIMRSISRDPPKGHEFSHSHPVKEKKSLKSISNKHNKQPLNAANKNFSHHKESTPQTKILQGAPINREILANKYGLNRNSQFGQCGRSEQNRRNFISFNTDPNRCLVNKEPRIQPQNQYFNKIEQMIPSVQSALIPPSVSIRYCSKLQHCRQKKLTSFYQLKRNEHESQPSLLTPNIDSVQRNDYYPQKQNLFNHYHVNNANNGCLLNFDSKVGQGQQKHSTPMENVSNMNYIQQTFAPDTRSQKVVRKSDVIQSIKFSENNIQNRSGFYLPSNLTSRVSTVVPSLVANDRQQKPTFFSSQQNKHRLEKVSTYRKEKMTTEPGKSFPQFQDFKQNQKKTSFINEALKSEAESFTQLYFPLDSIFSKNQDQVDCSKYQNQDTLTRQNSKVSMGLAQNPRFSCLTSQTKDSQNSKYQIHKDFLNRFSMTNSIHHNNFGTGSYVQYVKSNAHETRNLSNQAIIANDQQILTNVKKNNILNEQNSYFYERISKQKQFESSVKKFIEKHYQKYDPQQKFRSIDKQDSLTFQSPRNNRAFPSQQANKQNSQIVTPSTNCNQVIRSKKHRYSFFQSIQKQKRLRSQLIKNEVEVLDQTKSNEKSNNENGRSSFSPFQMKDAQSVVDSEGSSSDSELEFVVHSTNKVKLKSLAMLKSLHAFRQGSIREESENNKQSN